MGTAQNRELKRYRNQKILFRVSRGGWKIFRFLLLFGLCFILVYPLLYMLSMAFRAIQDVYDPSVIWVPKNFSLATIKEVIEVMNYPKALLNSLQVNGCGFFSCFGRIMLPNATPVMITTIVLSIVWYWNDYFMGSMLINGHETVTMALVNLPAALRVAGGYQVSDPYKFITSMQAGSLLTIAPVLLFYVIIQRFFIQGIARSGIVG